MKEVFNDIYIYGTGGIAKKLIKKYIQEGKRIVGILDRVRIAGTFEGIKIVEWREVLPGSAEAIIIAAPNYYCKEIYIRILHYCNAKNLKILDAGGNSLVSHFGSFAQMVNNENYAGTKEAIEEQIKNYDVISFDVFDTLLMRKVFDPLDVFSYVEAKLCKENNKYYGFRKCRRTAEVACPNGNIYTIYEKLSELMDLDELEVRTLFEAEIQCEKELIIARDDVVDILIEAKRLGKIVIAVSDMYFPEALLRNLLEDKGIIGIDKIFVSCDYKKSKSSGLFDIVKNAYPLSSIVHMGDNYYADVITPKGCGIDSIGINKGSDLLVQSPLGVGIGHMYTLEDSLWIGQIVVDLFKSPFKKKYYEYSLEIDSLESFVLIYFAPLIELYLDNLVCAVKHYEPEKLLFVARDGYVIQKCYEKLKKEKLLKGPNSYYILCSRRLAINVGLMTDNDLIEISNFLGFEDTRDFIKKVLGISLEDNECVFEDIAEYVNTNRESYVNYLSGKGISISDKCMLCELDGRGTSAYFLNNIFEKSMPAFFFEKINGSVAYNVSSYSVYDIEEINYGYSPFFNYVSILECLFSSSCSSVVGIDANGEFIYAEENRSKENIILLEKIHDIAIKKVVKTYKYKKSFDENSLSKELVRSIFETISEVALVGQCREIMKWTLIDDVTGKKIKVKDE